MEGGRRSRRRRAAAGVRGSSYLGLPRRVQKSRLRAPRSRLQLVLRVVAAHIPLYQL